MKEQIRKQNILNLIKYHAEKNEEGFRAEAYEIARILWANPDNEEALTIGRLAVAAIP